MRKPNAQNNLRQTRRRAENRDMRNFNYAKGMSLCRYFRGVLLRVRVRSGRLHTQLLASCRSREFTGQARRCLRHWPRRSRSRHSVTRSSVGDQTRRQVGRGVRRRHNAFVTNGRASRLVPTLPRGNTRLERSAFPQFHLAVSVPATRERRIRHSHAGAWERVPIPVVLAS
jgi:hypothetical protein